MSSLSHHVYTNTSFRPRLRPRGIRFPYESSLSPPTGGIQKPSHSAIPQRIGAHAKFQLSTTSRFGCALSVSQSLVTEEFHILY